MKRERKSPRYRTRRLWLAQRWWLPVAILVSLAIHALLLPVAVHLLVPSPQVPHWSADDTAIAVKLTTASEPPQSGAPRTKPVPPEPDVVPTPRPVPSPSVTKKVVAEGPTPVKEVHTAPSVPVPQPTATPQPTTPLPMTRVVPTTTGKFADRIPVPLPKGALSGDRRLEPMPVPQVVPTPEATPSPMPPHVADTDGGRAGGGVIPAAPQPTRPPDGGLAAGTGGGSGGGDTPTAGSGQGAGNDAGTGNGLGITRGIPFGDITGLSGGDPNGGGGRGGGPGGVFAPRSGGGARFTLRHIGSGAGPPVHIVYVVDTSGSMDEGDKIGQAKAALKKALDELRPEDSFNIITFSDTASLFSPSMRSATNANISAGDLAVDLMQPSGPTNLSAALELALAQPDVTHIFVLSDGEPTEGITDFDRLLEFTRERNAGRVRIITLALGLGERFKGMQLLRDLAAENRGRFDYINLARK